MKNKKSKAQIPHLNFSADDSAALLCALPLLANTDVGDFVQNKRNRAACYSAAEKLSGGISGFSSQELRVMYIAVEFALAVIGGTGNIYISPSDVDSEWRAELSRHLFSYNRLRPFFSRLFPDD